MFNPIILLSKFSSIIYPLKKILQNFIWLFIIKLNKITWLKESYLIHEKWVRYVYLQDILVVYACVGGDFCGWNSWHQESYLI